MPPQRSLEGTFHAGTAGSVAARLSERHPQVPGSSRLCWGRHQGVARSSAGAPGSFSLAPTSGEHGGALGQARMFLEGVYQEHVLLWVPLPSQGDPGAIRGERAGRRGAQAGCGRREAAHASDQPGPAHEPPETEAGRCWLMPGLTTACTTGVQGKSRRVVERTHPCL